MSKWIMAEADDIEWDEEDQTLDVLVTYDYAGAIYVQIPIELIRRYVPQEDKHE